MKKKKICIVCGGDYKTPKYNSTRTRYCSEKCRNRFFNRKYQATNSERNRVKQLERATIPHKDKLQCQICGRWYKKVGSHIWHTHKMTAREYREIFGFDVKRGQIREEMRAKLRDYVFETGTVKNLKKGKKFWFKKGQEGVGKYRRSPETLIRLRAQGKKIGELMRQKKKKRLALNN